MLAVVRRFAGPDVAAMCARYLLLDVRRSQQPYVAIAALALGDAQLARADAWIRSQVGRTFALDELAAAVGSTPWTLARRFQRVCGMSPSRYVQQVRAEEARRRLAEGARFEEAAYAVGFADPSALRRLLRRLEDIGEGDTRA
jgi:transcriptional regulator GlxA family with amidase domain